MVVKDCGQHEEGYGELITKIFKKFFGQAKKCLAFKLLVGVVVLALVTSLILYLVYRPSHPHFTLEDATVYALNLTGPAELTSTIQVTVKARNPNSKDGIYYTRLKGYATYCDQPITVPEVIPPTFQDTKETTIWSPFLRGDSVPIAPFIGDQLNQDRSFGGTHITIKFDGRIKWKLKNFITSKSYGIHVSCPAIIPFGTNAASNGVLVGDNAVRYTLVQSCSVTV